MRVPLIPCSACLQAPAAAAAAAQGPQAHGVDGVESVSGEPPDRAHALQPRQHGLKKPSSAFAFRFVWPYGTCHMGTTTPSLQLHWGLGTWEGRLWLCVTRSIHSVCMIQSIQIQFSHDQLLAPSPHRFLRSPGFDEHVGINCFCVCLLRRYALNLLCQKRRTLFTGPVPGSGSTHTR